MTQPIFKRKYIPEHSNAGFLETLVSDITYWPILPKVPLYVNVGALLNLSITQEDAAPQYIRLKCTVPSYRRLKDAVPSYRLLKYTVPPYRRLKCTVPSYRRLKNAVPSYRRIKILCRRAYTLRYRKYTAAAGKNGRERKRCTAGG